MRTIEDCVFNTRTIEETDNLVFSVLNNIEEHNNINFIINLVCEQQVNPPFTDRINTNKKNVLIEMNKNIYELFNYLLVNGKKIRVDFYLDININISETATTRILSGIIIPHFELDQQNKITIYFKNDPIILDELSIYLLDDNVIKYTNATINVNKNINVNVNKRKNRINNILFSDLFYNIGRNIKYQNDELQNIYLGILKCRAVKRIE